MSTQQVNIKKAPKARFALLFIALLFASMACNLSAGRKSPVLPTATITPGPYLLSPTLIPEASVTLSSEESALATKASKQTPTIMPPNIVASGLQVTEVIGYINTYGNLEVIGTVQNQTNRVVDRIEIEVQILDLEGNVLYTNKTYAALDHLTPGESAPFALPIYEQIAGASSYIAAVVGNGTTELTRADVQVVNAQMVFDRDGDIYVTGELVNTNDYPVIVSSMAAATTDSSGKLVTANYHSVLSRYLQPGESGYFRVSMSGPANGTGMIADYKLYLDAQRSPPLEIAPLTVTITNEYLDIAGNYHLVGEVTNLGDAHYSVSLVAGIYDNSGKVVDASDLTLALETLAPGETAPFDFTFWGPLNYIRELIATIAKQIIIVDRYWTWSTETGMVNLSTLANLSEYDQNAGHFSGNIVNSSAGKVDSATIIIALRDYQSGKIVAMNYDYNYQEMEPGATYDYTIDIPLWKDFDKTSVVVNYIVKGTRP